MSAGSVSAARSGGENGAALVAVLCMLVTVGMLAGALTAVSRIGATDAASFTDLMRSAYTAEGAAARIRFLIEADRRVFGDISAENIDFDEVEHDRYVADGSVHEIDYYGTPVKFTVSNGIYGRPVRRAADLDALKVNREDVTPLADAIDVLKDRLNDYTDADGTAREDGLEADDYEDLGMKPLPRNGPVQYREELLWIPGAADLLPADGDGRLSSVRNFRVDQSAKPSIYTATYDQLRTVGRLTEDEAVKALAALKKYREERAPLDEQLDETIMPQLRSNFNWNESRYYTVRIFQTAPERRPGSRLVFTFEADGVRGPASGVATFLEYFRF